MNVISPALGVVAMALSPFNYGVTRIRDVDELAVAHLDQALDAGAEVNAAPAARASNAHHLFRIDPNDLTVGSVERNEDKEGERRAHGRTSRMMSIQGA
jgi:hypothetical protein